MDSYHKLLQHVLLEGEHHADRTGVGTTSVFGYQWRHDMRTGFPLLTTKKVPLRWVFEELRWFLSGTDKNQYLNDVGVDIWDEWATDEQCAKFQREPGNLGPIYGPMMRSFPIGVSMHDDAVRSNTYLTSSSIDQIDALLDDIENSPNSRRLIVTHWHPYYAKRVTLPPCHTLWQCKVHQTGMHPDEMSLHLYARSIDAFLGLPFNIASYALLLEMLCRVTAKVPRDLIISFGDLHIYDSHRKQVAEQLNREPRPLPHVEMTPNDDGVAPLQLLLNLRWEHIKLSDYNPWPKIEAPVAV